MHPLDVGDIHHVAAASRWTWAIHCLSGTQLSQKYCPPHSFHAVLASLFLPTAYITALYCSQLKNKGFMCTRAWFLGTKAVICYLCLIFKKEIYFHWLVMCKGEG